MIPDRVQASPAFNDYTPLIFLASTPPSANGYQVAQAMELLISSRADVHRECGQMFAGRLVPLRFAARAQNEYGLATQQSGFRCNDFVIQIPPLGKPPSSSIFLQFFPLFFCQVFLFQ